MEGRDSSGGGQKLQPCVGHRDGEALLGPRGEASSDVLRVLEPLPQRSRRFTSADEEGEEI